MEKFKKYLHEAYLEIRKVTWPTKKETYQYTLLVIAITLGIALYTFVLDGLFNDLLNRILKN